MCVFSSVTEFDIREDEVEGRGGPVRGEVADSQATDLTTGNETHMR